LNNKIDRDTVEDLVLEVFRLNERYYKLIEVDSEQVLGPPATEAHIASLELKLGYRLPPSYKTFLSLHDGWHDWEGDQRLLSVDELERGPYFDHVRMVKQAAWEEGNSVVLEGLVIGACLSSASLLILDTRKVDDRAEMEIINWEHKEVGRYADFVDLLQNTAVDLRQIIGEQEQETRSHANDIE